MTPTAITGEGTFTSTVGQDNYSISSIKGQVGVQWNAILNAKRILTFGATYDFGGDLNPEVTKNSISATCTTRSSRAIRRT